MTAKANRFLLELWSILETPRYHGIVAWSGADSFAILDHDKFEKECLQQHFRSSSVQSFYRQLNMYGFRFKMTPDKHRSWGHPCFTPDRSRLHEIERKSEKKKQKKRPASPTPLRNLENIVQGLTKTIEQLVEENRAMRQMLNSFQRDPSPAAEISPQSRPRLTPKRPKKSIIKKKVDFQKDESVPKIVVIPPEPVEPEVLVVPQTVLRQISLTGLQLNTQSQDILFRRSRRNSRLLSIKLMDENEQPRDMLEQTRYNLPLSRAITVLTEIDTSKILD